MMHQQPLEPHPATTSPQRSLSPTDISYTPTIDSLGAQLTDSNSAARRPPNSGRGFNPRSCNTCRRRKVKCDKVEGGCGNCAKSHTECIYPGPGRAPRRPKSGAVKGATERETELLKRLRRLEGVVEELSGQVEIETIKTASAPAKQARSVDTDGGSENRGSPVRVVSMDEGSALTAREKWGTRMMSMGGGPPKADMLENELGKLVIDEGKSRYVSNSFWARSVSQSLGMTWIITDKV
jgi:Fungal Zn(2)-Cys(6) binuclear cluster domain